MKKYTKKAMARARITSGALTEAMMLAHNRKVDEKRAAKKPEKEARQK
jgi:hypothetical protein